MNIAHRIRFLRKLYNLTQDELAVALGVSKGNLSDWERDRSKPGASALISLSKYFDLPVDWILMGTLKANFSLEILSEKIRKERLKKNRQLSYVAEKLSISVEKYLSIEEGKLNPTEEELIALSFSLGCSIDYLIDDLTDAEYIVSEEESTDSIYSKRGSDYIIGKVQSGKTSTTMISILQCINATQLQVNDLTENEIKLIVFNRNLSDENKLRLEGYLKALLDTQGDELNSRSDLPLRKNI